MQATMAKSKLMRWGVPVVATAKALIAPKVNSLKLLGEAAKTHVACLLPSRSEEGDTAQRLSQVGNLWLGISIAIVAVVSA